MLRYDFIIYLVDPVEENLVSESDTESVTSGLRRSSRARRSLAPESEAIEDTPTKVSVYYHSMP